MAELMNDIFRDRAKRRNRRGYGINMDLFSTPKAFNGVEKGYKPRNTRIEEVKNRITFRWVNVDNAYLVILALLKQIKANYGSRHLSVDNFSDPSRSESLAYGGISVYDATLGAKDTILKKHVPQDSGKDGIWGTSANYDVREYALNILESDSSLVIKGSPNGGMWPYESYENSCIFVNFEPKNCNSDALKCYVQDEELELVVSALKLYIEEKDDNLEDVDVDDVAKVIVENYFPKVKSRLAEFNFPSIKIQRITAKLEAIRAEKAELRKKEKELEEALEALKGKARALDKKQT